MKFKKKYYFFWRGWRGGGGGGVRVDANRSEVIVKIQKKKWGGGLGVGLRRGQDGCERRIEFFCENSKKIGGGGGGGGSGQGGGGQVDVNQELKFLRKYTKKNLVGGQVGGGGQGGCERNVGGRG